MVVINPAVMVLFGVVAAGTVNLGEVTTRPVVTIGTAGVFNPVVSMVEDAIAVLVSVTAIFLPFLVILFLVIFAVSSILLLRRVRRLRSVNE